jgi:hypothetical protein
MILNLSALQSVSSTADEERRTKILYQIFLDEELRLKKGPSRTHDHTWN